MACPSCQKEAQNVIYLGLPMHLCSDDNCATLWGFWSIVPTFWFNGVFMAYTGSYIVALWRWLTSDWFQ